MGYSQMLGMKSSGFYVTVSSLEVLLARSLLSSCEADLVSLIREVQEVVDVPIRGVISEGQRSLRNAVRAVLPDVPHQLCHFHYLKEAAKPIYEADKHAKKELKKHLRGIRPIERAVEKRKDAEAEAIRGYCLAVRSALTDDGRLPLSAPGLKLYERSTAIAASLTRVSQEGACRVSSNACACFWRKGSPKLPPCGLMSNKDMPGFIEPPIFSPMTNSTQLLRCAKPMKRFWWKWSARQHPPSPSRLCSPRFAKSPPVDFPGLFHCYDQADLPRTNNDLEQYFGSARYHERRATGRKQAVPGVVIRGAVRVVASVASRQHPFSGPELCPTDLTRWRTLRSELNHRHEARRLQYRFRKSPEHYLAALEEKLSKERLPT